MRTLNLILCVCDVETPNELRSSAPDMYPVILAFALLGGLFIFYNTKATLGFSTACQFMFLLQAMQRGLADPAVIRVSLCLQKPSARSPPPAIKNTHRYTFCARTHIIVVALRVMAARPGLGGRVQGGQSFDHLKQGRGIVLRKQVLILYCSYGAVGTSGCCLGVFINQC